MKYLPVILFLLFFSVTGCITSPYKTVLPSELVSNSKAFEGKQVCIEGISENNTFSGITIAENRNFTGDYADGVLANICGTYRSGKLEPDSLDAILSISTDRDVYHSNETLKIHLDFNSPDSAKGQIEVAGIKNAFDRPLISEKREGFIEKGQNAFDFTLQTPSCEACSGLEPGVYTVNATISSGGKTFDTFRKITLEREESNDSRAEISQTGEIPKENIRAENITTNGSIVTVEYFYIPGCQKCEKATPVVEKVMNSFGGRVNFLKFNANEEGRDLAIKYQIPGTPSVVINNDRERLISYESYNGDTGRLEALLIDSVNSASVSPSITPDSGDKKIVLSVPYVFVIGLFAGFNPCLLAILAFIASVTMATTGRRRNVLLIVIMFSLGIFSMYLIVGIGLLGIFEQTPKLQIVIKNFLVLLIGILGLWHVYDAYHLRKNTESSFYTPKAFIRLTESVTKKVSLPASFFMGALFSLIKAPCVGAVYFVILDMVRSGQNSGVLYLAAYNFGVVFPVLVLGTAIAFGLNPEKVEKFRKERRSAMRLITGITLLVIAALMYAGII